MLQSLQISNFAIIESMSVDFSKGMNIITGETGAGKSILLGALNLVLGERADTKVLLSEEKKCVVEATFAYEPATRASWEADFDIDNAIILRREIAPSGKSRAFINDTPATLQQLREVGELLVNMHSQHETLHLIERGFQQNVLDTFVGIKEEVKQFQTDFRAYKKTLKTLSELKEAKQKNDQEFDFLSFQLNELQAANLTANEQSELEQEQGGLANVEEVKLAVQKALFFVDYSDTSLQKMMTELFAALRPVVGLNATLGNINERLISLQEELKDMTRELDRIGDTTEANPERLEEINQRLTTIYKLQKRHSVLSIEDLIALQDSLQTKLDKLNTDSASIESIEKEIKVQLAALLKTAENIHSKRNEGTAKATNQVKKLLQEVGMPNADFAIDLKKLSAENLNENGISELSFLFTANKGFELRPLKNVASGGELSRLMLCIKTLLADADHTPTMIFDEIDTGISGEVALRVGDIMNRMAIKHQLICITHLPQIARCGSAHYFVYKEDSGAKTITNIRRLTEDERASEIAKMIGGDNYSEAALLHAKELIKE